DRAHLHASCPRLVGAHPAHRAVGRPQLPPPSRRAEQRRRGLGHRCRRQALPRLPGRLLRAQLRPPQPAAAGGGPPAARAADADQPRVLQRPARPLRPRPRADVRQGHGPADEHRRRGRRDRPQGGAPLGLRGQGRAGGPGDDHRHGRQLPRPHHDDRQLLHRRGRASPLRAVHHRVPDRPLRQRRRARGGHRPHHRRCADRAHPGRGRGHHPAGGLPAGGAGALRPSPGPDDGGRDPVRARPHRPHLRLRPRAGRPGHVHPRQGARRRPLPGLGGGRGPRRARRDHAGLPRLHVRRQPAGRRPGPRGRGDALHRRDPAAVERARPPAARRPGGPHRPRGRVGALTRSVGRSRREPGAAQRPPALRVAPRARGPGEGHARVDDPARAAAGGHRGGHRLPAHGLPERPSGRQDLV
ncbi:MAG: Ornithine aminotransferase, partial [uncultured Nocardioidaceae bacterium]